jgi:serpin B
MTFNGTDNIKSVKIAASLNNYDIVKDLGEDNIRSTITNEYDEWLKSETCGPISGQMDTKSYVDKFIKDLDSNYKNVDVSSDFMIYNDDDVKVFAKDLQEYSGITLQYVGIMPKNKSLNEFINDTSATSLESIVSQLKEIKSENFKEGVVTKIKGNIPLFKFDYELNLMDDLQKMGVTDIFDVNKANLGGLLTESKNEYISKASHKANIEFSNEGIKAAAATALGGAGSTGCYFEHLYEVPVEEIDMTFDKPYMFLIKDKASGEVWFTGTVYEPLVK